MSSTRKSKPASRNLQALRIVASVLPKNTRIIGNVTQKLRRNQQVQAVLAGQRDEKTGKTPFMVACAFGKVKRVKELKDLAAPSKIIDVKDNHGDTALVYAIINHKNHIVDILLNEGKYQADPDPDRDPDIVEDYGYTPVEHAIESNNMRALTLLIRKGVDVNKSDSTSGVTPLMMAAVFGNDIALRILIRNGADVNKLRLDDEGKPLGSALLDAIEADEFDEGHIKVVKLLIGAGANVDFAKNDGTTPLIASAENGHTKVVKLLIGAGANVNLAKNDGTTPLMVSAKSSRAEVVRLLLDAQPQGADRRLTNNHGHTAYKYANGPKAYLIKSYLRPKREDPDNA